MQSLSSILLLVERGDRVHEGLNKALLVARHFRARLELFLCDTERYAAYPGSSASRPASPHLSCVTEGRDYLQALRKTIVDPDVLIDTDAVCELSLYDGLMAKLARTPVDLIVKAAEANRRDTRARSVVDWSMVSMCTAPLLLTRGRPWRPVPRFAVVAPAGTAAGGADPSAGVALAESLAGHCGAHLDFLVATSTTVATTAASGTKGGAPRPGVLEATCATQLRPEEVPDVALPEFIAKRDYDLVVVGKPPPGPTSALSSLAGRILARTPGDVVLVAGTSPGGF